MYINHRHYILLIVAVVTMLCSAAGYWVLYHTVQQQSIHAAEVSKEIALVDERKQHEQDAASIYAKTADERAVLADSLVSPDKAVDFIKSVEKIGDDVGVELNLSSITNEPASGGSPFGYFKGHVEARGSWSNIMKTLILIENMPYVVSLQKIGLAGAETPSHDSPTRRSWTLTLEMKALATK